MIHVYYGDGKGKTTAAMGLAMRAAGVGKQVVVVQFLKGGSSGEINILHMLPNVTLLRGKSGTKFSFRMNESEKKDTLAVHSENLASALALVKEKKCDMLILDEALGALSTGLLRDDEIRALVEEEQPDVELVFTGRNPPEYLLQAADYITEMKCVRHPYTKGILAREGVEF